MKVTHVIVDLALGGAQVSLFNLVSKMDPISFKSEVISLTSIGAFGEELQKRGVSVRALGMKNGVPSILGLVKLCKRIHESKPDLIQTWMVHANLITNFAVRIARIQSPILWGLRQGQIDPKKHGWKTILAIKTCGLLSWSPFAPTGILCNADACIEAHASYGYNTDLMTIIPNGFDTSLFTPNNAFYNDVRAEIGVSKDCILVGLVARFDPSKDHKLFIDAAEIINRFKPDVNFVLCGNDIDWNNNKLKSWIHDAGLTERFHLLGKRMDLPRIHAALNILVSSSETEAFSRVIGEAMSCGVPCVVTNVGDSAKIVGDTGFVVSPKDSKALSDAILRIVSLDPIARQQMGISARQRILDEFNLQSIVSQYEQFYTKIAHTKSNKRVRI